MFLGGGVRHFTSVEVFEAEIALVVLKVGGGLKSELGDIKLVKVVAIYVSDVGALFVLELGVIE